MKFGTGSISAGDCEMPEDEPTGVIPSGRRRELKLKQEEQQHNTLKSI
jgi:hypothetical protein